MLLHSQILIPIVIPAVGVSHSGDCTCDSGAEGCCCFARCPLPCYVSVPWHTCFCCQQKYQVSSTSRPEYGMVESRRLVSAGHGPVTSGLPVRGHACHAQSRRCRWGHGRHGVGPAARTPTARHVAHGSLTCASGGRSLCGALPAWSARAPRRCFASLRTRPRRDHGVASSIQNVPRPESGPLFAAGQ